LIDVCKDAQANSFEFEYPETFDHPGYKPTIKGHPKQIKAAAAAIAASKKPLLYVGGGVILSEAHKELFQLATKCNIPVATTLMARGAFPDGHELALQMLGMHGTAYANYAVQECDLLISVGARFDDRVTGHLAKFAPKAKKIHIDIDPAEIGKNVKIDIPIVGDCKEVLKALIEEVGPKEKHPEWVKQITDWKNKYPLGYNKGVNLKPQTVIQKLAELTKGQAIICTEVGQHQMWSAQFYPFTEPRTFITSGGLGTMGFGFPAAIGAQFARPDKIVVDIAGDGSIQMNIQEMATAVINRLPIKIVVLNNSFLGMVRQWQELLYDERYSQTNLCNNPDLVEIAKAYGAKGIRIDKPEELETKLKEALAYKDGPCLVDVRVEKTENVFPFVPPGQAINEMIVD
jgi:acetolactate synthase-1/2/3 large subunit